MKSISHYQYSVVITLLPFPLRYYSILRIEINLVETKRESYFVLFNNLVTKYRDLGFSVNEDKSSNNYTEYKNVIEFSLDPTTNIGKLAEDLEQDLNKNFESVFNTVRIKKEFKK